jgi:hypothetical protein
MSNGVSHEFPRGTKSELAKTALWLAAALCLVIAAASVEPDSRQSAIFSDQGELLFPRLVSVDAVKSIEVIDYNEAEAVARPLKAEFRNNRWLLLSHNDYPAEARDRVARTAAALVGLKRDAVVTDRFEDHAKFGVIDPLDSKAAALTGRGKHVTLRDASGAPIADLILGDREKSREGYRYVRIPGQKRVYAARTDAEPSARFEDWVEANLLRLSQRQIRRIVILSYSVDERFGRLAAPQRTVLTRDGETWKQEGGRALPQARIEDIVSALCGIRIVGVRPTPPEFASQLRGGKGLELTLDLVMSLRQRGFFVTPDGRLLANEGEIIVETEAGFSTTLRFGEIATSQEVGKSAPSDPAKAIQEPRFVFATSTDPALRDKFAGWFYIIQGSDFARLRPRM